MGNPSDSRASHPHLQRGPWSPPSRPPSHEAREGSRGRAPAHGQSAPLCDQELHTLRAWLVGDAALRPREAADLLAQSVRHRQLIHEPALHWRAVKARLAGEVNWTEMGFRLILD